MKNDYTEYTLRDLVVGFYTIVLVGLVYLLIFSEKEYQTFVFISICFVFVTFVLVFLLVPSPDEYSDSYYKSEEYKIPERKVVKKDIYDSQYGISEKMKCTHCRSKIFVKNKTELKCTNCGKTQSLHKSKKGLLGTFLGEWEEHEIKSFEVAAAVFLPRKAWNFMKCPNIYSAWSSNCELEKVIFGENIHELIENMKDANAAN